MPTNLLANFKPDAWMQNFAERAQELVSEPAHLSYFRDQLDEGYMRGLVRSTERKDWNVRRKQCLTDGQASDRLRDWKAGPPSDHPDWILEYCPEITGSVWLPPEYAIGNEPDTSPPLPFKDRESTLWEAVAILAAIHDLVCRNVDPIVPKQDLQSGTRRDTKFGVVYLALLRQIPKLTERDRPALERCLTGVCANLKVPAPAVIEPPATKGKVDPPNEYIFRLSGNIWHLKFGTEEGDFSNSKGLQRIRSLLEEPNTPISGLTLCGSDSRCEMLTHSNDRAFDPEGLANCNRELEEYDEEIEKAKKNADEAQLVAWTKKKDELLAQLKRDTRLGGGSRTLGKNNPAKSALVNVKESIRDVRKKLRKGELMSSMADHLQQHIKTEESSLAYRPSSPAPNWTF